MLLLGIIQSFGMTPAAQAHNQQFAAFQHDLERLGVTRIYSDYWTCDRVIFQSQERILCSVLDDDLRPGLNRYPAYAASVAADPRAAYAFVEGSPQAQALAAAATDATWRRYQRMELDGYVVYLYQPAPVALSARRLNMGSWWSIASADTSIAEALPVRRRHVGVRRRDPVELAHRLAL